VDRNGLPHNPQYLLEEGIKGWRACKGKGYQIIEIKGRRNIRGSFLFFELFIIIIQKKNKSYPSIPLPPRILMP
jgi:hypothetical protein